MEGPREGAPKTASYRIHPSGSSPPARQWSHSGRNSKVCGRRQRWRRRSRLDSPGATLEVEIIVMGPQRRASPKGNTIGLERDVIHHGRSRLPDLDAIALACAAGVGRVEDCIVEYLEVSVVVPARAASRSRTIN